MKSATNVSRISRLAGAGLLVWASACAQASPVAIESFDYASGTDLAGQNGGSGFGGAWQAGGFNAFSSLNFDVAGSPVLAPTTGSFATTTAVAQTIAGVTRSLSTSLGGNGSVYYVGMLVRPEGAVGDGLFSGFFGLTLGNNIASYADEVFVGKPGGGAVNHYVLEDRGGANQSASNDVASSGALALLVLKLSFGASGSEFSLYVDPLPGLGEPATADASKLNPNLASVNYLGLYSTGAFSIDEIRIGTTFADVVPGTSVPEPATLALLPTALALAGLAGARRRRAMR